MSRGGGPTRRSPADRSSTSGTRSSPRGRAAGTCPARRRPARSRAEAAVLTFGVMFRPGHFPLSHMLECLTVAEDVGFDHAWFGDSHLIWHEVGPYLTAAAMS